MSAPSLLSDHLAAALAHLTRADRAADRARSWLPWRARAAQRQSAEELVLAIASTLDALHLVADRTRGEPPS
jgi:hypothetical protein